MFRCLAAATAMCNSTGTSAAAREWELPAQIRCGCSVTPSTRHERRPAGDRRPGPQQRRRRNTAQARRELFSSEHGSWARWRRCPLTSSCSAPRVYGDPGLTLITDCAARAVPRSILVESPPGTVIARETIRRRDLSQWTATAPGKELVIDPLRGRLLFVGAAAPDVTPRVGYCYGSPTRWRGHLRPRAFDIADDAAVVAANAAVSAATSTTGTATTAGSPSL